MIHEDKISQITFLYIFKIVVFHWTIKNFLKEILKMHKIEGKKKIVIRVNAIFVMF